MYNFIKSFVLQNFYQQHPLVEKNSRHIHTVFLKNFKLIHLFFLNYLSHFNPFNKKNFNMFLLYSYVFIRPHNNLTYNLTYSIKQELIKNTLNTFSIEGIYLPSHLVYYWDSVKVFSVIFRKNKLTKLLYINMYTLLTHYYNYYNTYNLSVTTLPIHCNFYFYTFINLFFIKVRNL